VYRRAVCSKRAPQLPWTNAEPRTPLPAWRWRRQLGDVHSNAPRLILPSLGLDWDDDGNAMRQSAAAMTRGATDAATMIKPMIVACTMTIGAIYQGRVEAPAREG
jgi:hypothetical protein